MKKSLQPSLKNYALRSERQGDCLARLTHHVDVECILVPKKALDQSTKDEYYFDYALSNFLYQILSSQVRLYQLSLGKIPMTTLSSRLQIVLWV